VSDQSPRLHLAQHRRDGGVGQAAFLANVREHAAHRGFSLLPKNLHDPELQVAEPLSFLFTHALSGYDDHGNTTMVVVPSTKTLHSS
jgi:hypothetical protein